MSKNDVNIGASPDDGNGDPLRTAFNKLNNTLAEVYSGLGDGSNLSLSLTSNGILNVTTKVTSTATVTQDDATTLTTKGYVDSQFNTADTLPEVLTRGNTTGGSDIAVSADDDITFTDSSEAIFGSDADLQIYHDGTNAKIVNSTGALNISGGNVNISGGNLAAPTFLGELNGTINTATTGVTQLPEVDDTTIATTAFANAAAAAVPIADYLPLAGGTLTGNLQGTNAAFSAKLAVGTGAIPNETMLITSGSTTSFKVDRTGANAGYLIFSNSTDHNAIISRGAGVPTIQPKDLRFNVGSGTGTTKMTLSSTGTDISSPLTADAATFSGALTGTSATFSGSITTNLSAEGTYFIGGSGGVRQLSITSGTNSSEHALHTFNIASSNGKYKFDVAGTEQLSLAAGNATFTGNVQSGNFAIGGTPVSFGGGVSTILLKGTAANNRAGAIQFKDNDNDIASQIYVTNGGDDYGTVINTQLGDFKIKMGALSIAYNFRIQQNGNVTFAGGTIIKSNGVVYLGYTDATAIGGNKLEVSGNIYGSGNATFAGNTNISGNLGVGMTTAPDYKLHVKDASPIIAAQSTGTNNTRLLLSAENNAVYIGSTYSTSNMPMYFTQAGTSGGVKRMTIAASGNVGIGYDPKTRGTGWLGLDIGGTTAAEIGGESRTRFTSNVYYNGTNDIYKNDYGALSYYQDAVSSSHIWYTAPTGTGGDVATLTEKMRITSGGDIAFGTTANDVSGGAIYFDELKAINTYIKVGHKTGSSSGSDFLACYYNGAQIGGVAQNGTTAVQFNTGSDYRLKEDLQDFNGLDMISNIPVYDFKWKVDESRSYGVMAHELQEVLPNAVVGEKDATEEYEITPAVLDEEGNVSEEAVMGTRDVCQGVDYSKIVPLLVKSIQELKAEIELLKLNN